MSLASDKDECLIHAQVDFLPNFLTCRKIHQNDLAVLSSDDFAAEVFVALRQVDDIIMECHTNHPLPRDSDPTPFVDSE